MTHAYIPSSPTPHPTAYRPRHRLDVAVDSRTRAKCDSSRRVDQCPQHTLAYEARHRA